MVWPFSGKGKAADALTTLSAPSWHCASCGGEHHGLIDLASRAPDYWPRHDPYESNEALPAALAEERDFLSEDFCVIGNTHFFVRSVLEIPVRGLDQVFAFGCWGTLSRDHFDTYAARFDSGDYGEEGPWYSWLSNILRPYVTDLPLGCAMHLRNGRQRPRLRVEDEHHPLAIAQEVGISPEEMLDIYDLYGHRPRAA